MGLLPSSDDAAKVAAACYRNAKHLREEANRAEAVGRAASAAGLEKFGTSEVARSVAVGMDSCGWHAVGDRITGKL